MPVLADPGYQGAGHGIHIPFKQPDDSRPLAADNRTYNALLRALRCPGERGFSLLTERWTTLKHITLSRRQNRRPHQSRPRTHPFRAPQDHLKVTEKTPLSTLKGRLAGSIWHRYLRPHTMPTVGATVEDETLSANELLPSIAEQNAAKAGNCGAFGGFSVPRARKDVTELLGSIRTNGMFDEYTRHDITHIDTMLSHLAWLVPETTQEIMSPADWLLIVLGVYFHDLGMLVTKEEYEKRWDSAFPEFKRAVHAARDDQTTDYASRISSMESHEAERFLYQEFVRTHHARRIRAWIQGEEDPAIGVARTATQEVQRIIAPLDEVFRDDLAIICESHHLDDLFDVSKYPVSRPYGPTPDETANVQYAAALLRTVDLLHITRDRTPSITFRLIDPQDPVSQIEWAKQGAVRSIRAKLGIDSEGNRSEDAPRDSIEVHARFSNGDGFFGLTAYLSYAQSQLKKTHDWVSQASKSQGARHQFPWTKIDTANIETKGFLSEPFEFTFDQTKVLDLLTGHTLYNDSSVVVRELVQNSLDAVRLFHGDNAPLNGHVEVIWDSEERSLEVRDNGTGMTQDIIEQNLLRVGSSRYQEPRFKKEHPDFNPISRFGIGVLSAFMIADRVEVVTCHPDEKEARQLSLRSVHGKYLVRLLSKNQPPAQELGPHGTLVRLWLRPSAKLPDILGLVRRWIILPGCTVTVAQSGMKAVQVGYSSVKDALSDALILAGFAVPEDEEQTKDLKVIQRDLNGISIAYALRWDSYFKEWAFLSGESPKTETRVSGTSVEGVRVEDSSPGFRNQGPWAFVNISGPGTPKTNVARSAIEFTGEYVGILRDVYSLYCQHISDEISAMQTQRGHSLTWATSEAAFLLNPLLGSVALSDSLFDVIRELPLFVVEKDGVRYGESLSRLGELDYLWTLESAFSFHFEQLLREIPGVTSLSLFLRDAGGSLLPENQGPLMCTRLNDRFSAVALFLEDWQIAEIIADEEHRRCSAKWVKQAGEALWSARFLDSDRYPEVARALIELDPELIGGFGIGRRPRNMRRICQVPLGAVTASGFENREYAVLLSNGHYLLPGHPFSELISDGAGCVDNQKAHALASIITLLLSGSREYFTGSPHSGISARDLAAMEAMIRESRFSALIDLDEFFRIFQIEGWRSYNVNKWTRVGGW